MSKSPCLVIYIVLLCIISFKDQGLQEDLWVDCDTDVCEFSHLAFETGSQQQDRQLE